MKELNASVIEDIELASWEIARQTKTYFEEWQAGKVYISKSALRAMGRRYLYLRDAENLRPLEVYEFGRLYAFFCLLYPPDGDIFSAADIAVDFCNLLVMRQGNHSPTE